MLHFTQRRVYMGFWNFPRSSKLDILDDRRHVHIYLSAFRDPETQIEAVDRESYCLYGLDEALLAEPRHPFLKLAFAIYCMIYCCFKS